MDETTTTAPETSAADNAYPDEATYRAAVMEAITAPGEQNDPPASVEAAPAGVPVAEQGTAPAPTQAETAPPDPVATLAAQVSALTGIVEKFISAQAAPAVQPAQSTAPVVAIDPDVQAVRHALGGDHVPEYLATEEHQRRQRLAQWRAYEAKATDDKEKARVKAQMSELERQGQRIKHEVERERRLMEAEKKLREQTEAPEREQEVAQRVERAKTVLTAEKVTPVYPQLGAAMTAGHVDLSAAFDALAKSGALAGTPEEYGQTVDAVLGVLNAAFKAPAPEQAEPPAVPPAPAAKIIDPGSVAPVTSPGVTKQPDRTSYPSHRELKAQMMRSALGTV